MKNTKHVGIVCGYPFPEGMAATNRIISYSKGLIENGVDVDVLLFNPKVKDLHNDGIFNGINYFYPSINWSRYKIFRFFLDKVSAQIFTCFNIYSLNKKNEYDYILISSDALNILFLFVPFIKLLGLKLIFITDEYPKPIRVHLKNKIPKYKEILYSIILQGFSAMVYMTSNLSDFYNKICQKPSFILPTITDISRFDNIISNRQLKNNDICYMGNLELSKDNVDNIINAFSLIKNKYEYIQLQLYGEPNNEDRLFIERLIEKFQLERRVFLKGRANYSEVPFILINSHVLVSSQPDTLRADGGFPTKLGEYLASGVPVLLTEVGEISKYVKDKETVFLCEPDSPIQYATRLAYILDNYDEALKVAMNGRKFLIENFSSISVGHTFKVFLNSI
jgi:glycosyltransferase involved in cell wall biosynthesis